MNAKLIDGKKVSAAIREKLKAEVAALHNSGITPGLAVVIVGDDPASHIYVRNKVKTCAELGIYSVKHELAANTAQEELMELIRHLNSREDIHGILVQMPLPAHLDAQLVVDAISPQKDVDAFHAQNVGKIMIGNFDFLPCTPAGVMELLKSENIEISGKECAVIGRSNIVGKPMAMLLLHQNGTVTMCHSRTAQLAEVTKRADILVSAIGKANFVTADMVKPGAIVLDVGINRNADGKLCGDVDFQAVGEIASYITPVPGGVGPMTITMLMRNTITAAKLFHGLD